MAADQPLVPAVIRGGTTFSGAAPVRVLVKHFHTLKKHPPHSSLTVETMLAGYSRQATTGVCFNSSYVGDIFAPSQ
jgi:hypothetical protein